MSETPENASPTQSAAEGPPKSAATSMPTSTDSAPSESPASSATADDDTIFGVKSTYVYIVCSLLTVILLGVIAVFALRRQKQHQRRREAQMSDSETDTVRSGGSSDTSDLGNVRHRRKGHTDMSDSSSGNDRRSLGRFAALREMQHLAEIAAQESVYTAAAKDPQGLSGLAGHRSGTTRADPRPRFELAKPQNISGSSDSDESEILKRSLQWRGFPST